jgi:hypothetical protein
MYSIIEWRDFHLKVSQLYKNFSFHSSDSDHETEEALKPKQIFNPYRQRLFQVFKQQKLSLLSKKPLCIVDVASRTFAVCY